jgi:5'-3' exonuclease
VAPSEAEAQCAFLDIIGLTHGTVTDDSDVWVFGGQKIYKNFFNQDRHCESFTATEVAKHFGLSREKMILLAMLTGKKTLCFWSLYCLFTRERSSKGLLFTLKILYLLLG